MFDPGSLSNPEHEEDDRCSACADTSVSEEHMTKQTMSMEDLSFEKECSENESQAGLHAQRGELHRYDQATTHETQVSDEAFRRITDEYTR